MKYFSFVLLFWFAGVLGFGAAGGARAQSTLHLEAEAGTLSGGAAAGSAGGVTYVTGFTAGGGSDTFSGVAATAGRYELMVRYRRTGSGGATCAVSANGAGLTAALPPASAFSLTAAGAVTLTATGNVIILGGGSGGYDIDFIELRPIIRVEAEAGALSGTAGLHSNAAASGGKYVEIDAATGSGGASSGTTLSVSAPAGLYDLQIGYQSPYGQKQCAYTLSNTLSSTVTLTSTSWATVDAGLVMLNGSDTLSVGGGWGYYNLDYVTLTPAAPDAPPLPVSTTPVDPNATPQAGRLLSYLGSLYGGRMLSGQHTLDEFPFIAQATGQQPAVLGIDLIDYSPSRTLYGTMPGVGGNARIVEPAIAQQAANNNIVDVMWHWNAPDDLINVPGEYWYSGFYTAATTYNLAAALANPNSNDYRLLIADMDTVAQQLQKFQQAGVPVLWRPLHEASGAFFWWGAQGPDAFQRLWRLMYDRFTGPLWNMHNLIWVYGGSDPSWYPGDSYVDIVGADIYDSSVATFETDPTYTVWKTYRQAFDGRKMIAATEVGGVPNPALLQQYGVDWLFYLTWPGFNEQVSTADLHSFYNTSPLLNAVGLPGWNWTPANAPLTSASVSGPQNAGGNGWYTGPATVTLSGQDSNTITATYYTLDNGPARAYTGPFPVSGDGIHPVTFWSVDSAGGTETAKARTILIDGVAPASACTAVAVNSSGYQVSLTASDTGSGAQVIEYKIDGGSVGTTTTFSAPIAVSGAGSHTLAYWSIDVAGNVEPTHTLPLTAASARGWTAVGVSTGADGFTRVLWDKSDGTAAVWKVNSSGGLVTQQQFGPYTGWTAQAVATGKDNQTRLLWTNTNGTAAFYLLDANGAFITQQQFGPYAGWTAQGIAAAPDGTARALWTNTDGTATVWTLDGTNHLTGQHQYGPYGGWTARSLTVSPDGTERLLWTNSNGTAAFWRLDGNSQMTGQQQYGPYSGYAAQAIAAAPDGTARVVWTAADAHIALWTIDATNNYVGQAQFGPYTGWAFQALAVGADGNARLLWDNVSGQAALWSITPGGAFAANTQFGPY